MSRTWTCADCSKTTFSNWENASKRARELPVPARVYWCAAAGGYHVTSMDEAEYQRRQAEKAAPKEEAS